MKKRFLFLLLAIGLTSVAYTDYLDDWPDDALCGWMDNPSPPSYMVEEANTRGISCSGGVAINNLPDPPIEPPIEPPIDPPIRPGWKILEGTDMLVINDEDPYWQTEEGLIERPPKIDPGIEYAPETVPGADPKIVPDLPPEVDKPPSDPNPPPILDDPTVLQPVDPGIQGDVEITEAPAPVPTQRPDMFSAAAVKYATTVTSWAEMGIPAAIVKKYLKDPTGTPSDAINATKAMNVAAAEAESAASAAAAEGAETAAETAAKASAVAEAEAASAADEASACSRLPEGEKCSY